MSVTCLKTAGQWEEEQVVERLRKPGDDTVVGCLGSTDGISVVMLRGASKAFGPKETWTLPSLSTVGETNPKRGAKG